MTKFGQTHYIPLCTLKILIDLSNKIQEIITFPLLIFSKRISKIAHLLYYLKFVQTRPVEK